MRVLRVGVGLLLCGMILLGDAFAASMYDPEIEWGTLKSPRFSVHYPEGARNLALRISRVSEDVLDEITELLGFVPEGTIEIVLSDAVDFANGSAQVMPKNIIRIFVAAPTELTGLSAYEDWIRILLIHEITHVVDIDQSWGLTRLGRWLLGKYVALNGFTPQFFTEGVAVYSETLLTSTGRGRSTYVDMMLRTAALEDRFLGIDQANILYSDWPGGSAAYYYGGKFHLWLAEKFGREAVATLHRFNAGMPIPYFYYPGAKWSFGQGLPTLWDQWREEVKVASQTLVARLKEEGLTESTRLTHHGRNIGGAQYSPSGDYIIYSRSSPVDGATVRRVNRDGTGDRYLVLQTYSPRFSFEQDGSAFYFSQSAINERFNSYNDLYRFVLDGEKYQQIRDVDDPEKSLRARSPDVSADGSKIVFVQNKLHQSWVSVGEFVPDPEKPDDLPTKIKMRTLIAPNGDMQHASPRFSPDGSEVVVSTWFPGGHRDLIIVDATTGALKHRVTNDMALDGNPTWSPDGAYLLFESDRDGISNIYGYQLETGRHYRVTRVIGGAFQPDVASDGSSLLFRACSGIGFDIHEIPYAPSTWEPLGLLSLPLVDRAGDVSEPGAPVLLGSELISPTGTWRAEEAPEPLGENEVDLAYSPFETLLPFQDNWILLPGIYWMNDDPSLSLATFGADVLGEHSYSVSLGSSVFTEALNWGVGYANNVWLPTFSAGVFDFSASLNRGEQGYFDPLDGGSAPGVKGADLIYSASYRELQRTVGTRMSMSLPVRQRHYLGVSYRFERRTREARMAYRSYQRGGELKDAWEQATGESYNSDQSVGPVEDYPEGLVNPFKRAAAAQLNQGCFGEGEQLGQCDFAWLEVGYSYNNSRVYPHSVSREQGGAVGASAAYYSEAFGGDFDELLLNFDGSLYVNNPLFDNHVLSMRLRGAIAFGPDFEETFLLGGDYSASLFQASTARTFPLRGFELSTVEQKTGLLAAYFEYRFPLWHIERGIWTLPVYFERLHAAVFLEGGNSFGKPGDTDLKAVAEKGWNRLWGGKASVGAELRATMTLGWAFPFTFRFGAAWPIVDHGLLRQPKAVPVLPTFLLSLVVDDTAFTTGDEGRMMQEATPQGGVSRAW